MQAIVPAERLETPAVHPVAVADWIGYSNWMNSGCFVKSLAETRFEVLVDW